LAQKGDGYNAAVTTYLTCRSSARSQGEARNSVGRETVMLNDMLNASGPLAIIMLFVFAIAMLFRWTGVAGEKDSVIASTDPTNKGPIGVRGLVVGLAIIAVTGFALYWMTSR
jgi:hypothetical protein